MTLTPDSDSPGDTPTAETPGGTVVGETQTGPAPVDDALTEALRQVVAEVEQYVDDGGWDSPRQMFALVPTAELLAHEPGLVGQIAEAEGTEGTVANPYTPVEQGEIPGESVAEALAKIAWPDQIDGCVLVIGIMTESDDHIAEGRLAVGVLRDRPGGACAIRWRHAPNGPVTYGPDLAPELVAALHATFED